MRVSSVLALVVVAFLAIGCQNQDKSLQTQNQQLTQANQQLQQQLAQAQRLQADLAARDARIRQLEDQLKSGKAPGLEGLETSYNAQLGELTVNLPGDILFDSGSATLKKTSQATLNKVLAALKSQYAGKPIRVEGHTDTDPILHVRSKWADNLELSLERAAAVTRYLEKSGLSPKLVTTSGFGEYRPRESKARSRRVEIVVLVRQPVSSAAQPALRPAQPVQPAQSARPAAAAQEEGTTPAEELDSK
jgi:chemotaxis protein MotB